jgi:two-component system, NarL family, nitrate/nitrite response regulator NarL
MLFEVYLNSAAATFIPGLQPAASVRARIGMTSSKPEAEPAMNGRPAPRVLVAGHDSATINGIRLALEDEGIVLCGRVANAAELVDGVTRLEPDLCLVDVDLPGGGIVAAAEMRAWRSRVAVVMLASELNEDDFLKAMAVGAIGYLPKSISPKRLPAVIRAVLLGEPAIPRPLVAVLMNRLRGGGTRRHLVVGDGRGVDLTSREWDVLDAMRDGLTTREIAAKLLIADVTVRRHVGAVLKKLHVQSRREALELLRSA